MEMESHEEKLYNMIKSSKMDSAKDQAKVAAKNIMERKRMEGIGGGSSGSALEGGSSMGANDDYERDQAVRALEQQHMKAQAASAASHHAPVKGMDILVKTDAKNKNLYDALVKEEKLAPIIAKSSTSSRTEGESASSGVVAHPIMLQAVEKITAQLTRDGDVTNVEVKGNLTLTATDDDVASCAIQLSLDTTPANPFTTNTHPKVNKPLYDKNQVLMMKDTNKCFPSGRPVGILRWSNSQSSADFIPITITCWPEEESKNRMLVTIEYSATTKFQLHDVKIRIPIHSTPEIKAADGRYKHNKNNNELIWEIDMIDGSNSSGDLEFSITEKDPDSFFPITVSFSSQQMYYNVDVVGVKNIPPGADIGGASNNIMYGYTKGMLTEEYTIE